MSLSPPQLIGFLGGMTIIYLTAQVAPWPIAIVVACLYVVSAWLFWKYSPYVHRHRAYTTAPEVVKEQDWGFNQEE